MINIFSYINSILPPVVKVKKLEYRETHNDGKRNVQVTHPMLDIPYNRDMDIPDDKVDQISEFERWFRDIFEHLAGASGLSESYVNFPGVFPGTTFASLKLAKKDLKVELLKALNRAQSLGLIKDYNTKIVVDGKEYTIDELPDVLAKKILLKIQKKIDEKETNKEISTEMNNSKLSMPMGETTINPTTITSAKKFPPNKDILGETYMDSPEHTDNKESVEDSNYYRTTIKPYTQYDGPYPFWETYEGSDNPYARIWEAALWAHYFFGI